MAKRRKKPDAAAIAYRVTPADPAAHVFGVECVVRDPDASGQTFTLPAWIPGSYMIREFARNIVSIEATCEGEPVEFFKRDKHTWQAAPCTGPLRLSYRVYAWDPSVRAAHLDDSHGFFNGTSLFVRIDGQAHLPHDVELVAGAGEGLADWRVATTLPSLAVAASGFGSYRASDYDALIDHPVEMGTFRQERFDASGTPHEVAWTGAIANFDAERVNRDLATLCAAQIRFFGDAPFDRYLFLVSVRADGYGGLEHRASTALVCARDALPAKGEAARGKAYLGFLGLASHEYFHSWNVKRMKPAAFVPYRLDRENHTSLLWIFEGFTSYYDDLFLVRTGLASETEYFDLLARTIDDVASGAGRHVQSIAESSFDAWIKYYRQDENAGNAIVSYYKKGSLVGLCLDLLIRRRSKGERSLDDVMRRMWARFGKDFERAPTGLAEDGFPALVAEATGVTVDDEIGRWAHGTDELPLAALLEPFGVALDFEPERTIPSLGGRIAVANGETRLATVDEGGAAHAAGLSAGDVLVAIDGVRAAAGKLDTLLARYRAGDRVEVVSFRGDLLQRRSLRLAASPTRAVITVADDSGKRAARLRKGWLRAA